GITVDVSPGFLPPEVTSADVLMTVFGPNPGLFGLSQSAKNATAVTAAAGPTLAGVAPASAGRGAVGRTVVLTGANFAPDASVSFGAGVSVTGTSVDNPTQITVTVDVSPGTSLGLRDVSVTNVSAGQSASKAGAFQLTGTPTVTGVSGPLVRGLDNQLVTITGLDFTPPTTTPPDLLVTFTGAGITLPTPPIVGYTNETTITVVVNVTADAAVTTSHVTVTNPDGGADTAMNAVSVAATGGLAAPPHGTAA